MLRNLFVALALVTVAPLARADGEDARKSARELYNQAYALQQQGNEAEALRVYRRANTLFPAPTTAFRIAECEIKLGLIVEAAETLRAIATSALPSSASSEFVKAKREAAADLGRIEPKIPKLTLRVSPAEATEVTVTIDGHSLDMALLGVPYPQDPGPHEIEVHAKGYAPTRVTLELHEGQQMPWEITLRPAPPVGVASVDPTREVPREPDQVSKQSQRLRPELLLGLEAGAAIGGGGSTGGGIYRFSDLGVGAEVQGEVGVLLARRFSVAALAGGDFFQLADGLGSAAAFHGDAAFGYNSNPDGVGFFGELGGGFCVLTFPLAPAQPGGEALAGVGVHFKLGPVHVVPKSDVRVVAVQEPFGGTAVGAMVTIGLAGRLEL